ncbi:uncharacterized protein LOC120251239 [Dioscorea cayenensis subsp. rotundata]|uniref:Uncharacterized protein LOC120251239 n=1 Tax=Dioscorea cayennensis subsp. rotundata TaxID=55577 RepID=A0AB40ALZ6_DIOCR|nr:uncharacterized protein LOC120251239 [Dioscorea cayenensis subsp. rotundata]
MVKKLLSKKPKKIKSVINEDVVTEILLRLPTKSIFKFKSTSKTWLKIINDPWFANTYKSSNGLPVLAGLFHVNYNYELKFNPVNHRLKSPSLNHLPLDLKDLSVTDMLSSNGFFLLCTSDDEKIVYNPVTRRRLMIPKMERTNDWYHAFGLIHENDNHIKVVFAYKLASDDIQTALEIHRFTRDNKLVGRDELPQHWPELIVKWQCKTKDIEFKVYCSKKKEWNSKILVSTFPRHVCFEPEQQAGVSIGGDLYWMTLDGSVLDYNSEREAAELISAPVASEGLKAKSLHCSANGILVYCACDRKTEEVVIWELIDRKIWAAKKRVKLHGVEHLHMEMILYVCHEMQALFFQTRAKEVYRFGVSEEKLELICPLSLIGDQVTPYMMSPWPAALNGDEAWPSSSSSSENKDSGSKDR